MYWVAAKCAIDTPALPQAYIVRPEQSNVSGPAAANWYGLLSWALAAFTAMAAEPVGGGRFSGAFWFPEAAALLLTGQRFLAGDLRAGRGFGRSLASPLLRDDEVGDLAVGLVQQLVRADVGGVDLGARLGEPVALLLRAATGIFEISLPPESCALAERRLESNVLSRAAAAAA